MSNKNKPSFFKGVRSEMRRVTWPTWKELVQYTGVVILISTIISISVYLVDLGLGALFSLFIGG